MMKRTLLMVALLTSVATAVARGQEGPPVPPGPNEHVKPLEFLIGTWEGEGEMPGMGKFHDQTTYEWGVNKQFLVTKYVAKGPKGELYWQDQGIMGWDPEKKTIFSYGFGMDGSIGRGYDKQTSSENVWVSEGTSSGGDPSMAKWRLTTTKTGSDTLTIKMETFQDGQYKEFFTTKSKKTTAEK